MYSIDWIWLSLSSVLFLAFLGLMYLGNMFMQWWEVRKSG